MPEQGQWTVADLVKLDYELRYELINGTLHMMTLTGIHQEICGTLVNALRPPREELGCFTSVYGMSLEVDQANEPRADVVIAPLRHFDRNTIPAKDLLLVAEVLWPDSADRDRGEKADIYAREGVPAYWLIDPSGDRIMLTAYRLGASGYRTVFEGDGVFHNDWPWPSTIDLPEMTARRDQIFGPREAATE